MIFAEPLPANIGAEPLGLLLNLIVLLTSTVSDLHGYFCRTYAHEPASCVTVRTRLQVQVKAHPSVLALCVSANIVVSSEAVLMPWHPRVESVG